MRFRTILERLPVAVIAVALVLLLGTLAMAVSPRFRALLRPAALAAYQVGDQFEGPTFVTQSARALVVVAGPNCGATERAHTFLADAVSAATAAGDSVWLFTSEAAHPEIEPYAARLGIDARHIVAVDPSATKIRIMPTLALVNRRHIVLRFWEGAPDTVTGEAILTTLRTDARQ